MAYTSTELITRSFYLSGVVSRQLQTVSGPQISNGLDLLNSCLSFQSASTRLIPYYVLAELPLVAGQEEYFIPGLFDVESFTFDMEGVRFSSLKLKRYQYFATPRPLDITSLPATWNWQRQKGGTLLSIYFKPEQAWGAHIMGKFGLTNVDFNTDLDLSYDDFYIEYLRYALAKYICQDYKIRFPSDCAAMLRDYELQLKQVTVPDFRTRKRPLIGRRNVAQRKWAYYNIGQGWVPV